jgi:hypothetical protein
MTSLPNTVGPNGQIIVNSGPPLHTGFIQHIQGSPLEAAAGKTLAAQQAQISAAKSLGAGQKGASRRHRKKRQRGGVNLTANIPSIPEAGTIPGISHAQNHVNGINNLNQIRHDQVYDGLTKATPIKMGGFRFRDAEEMYPGSGTHEDTKHRRKTKKKHGSRHKRTHRRVSRKSSARRSRGRRSHK